MVKRVDFSAAAIFKVAKLNPVQVTDTTKRGHSNTVSRVEKMNPVRLAAWVRDDLRLPHCAATTLSNKVNGAALLHTLKNQWDGEQYITIYALPGEKLHLSAVPTFVYSMVKSKLTLEWKQHCIRQLKLHFRYWLGKYRQAKAMWKRKYFGTLISVFTIMRRYHRARPAVLALPCTLQPHISGSLAHK